MAQQNMVIFTRTFDFLTWLLPMTNHFPRAHRFTFTQPLLRAAFTLYEHLETANHRRGQERATPCAWRMKNWTKYGPTSASQPNGAGSVVVNISMSPKW